MPSSTGKRGSGKPGRANVSLVSDTPYRLGYDVNRAAGSYPSWRSNSSP